MGNLFLLLAAPAAVLAAIIFWNVFDIQHGDYDVHRAESRVERAQFDADFAKSFNGTPNAAAEQRVESARTELASIKDEAKKKKDASMAKAQSRTDDLDALLSSKQHE